MGVMVFLLVYRTVCVRTPKVGPQLERRGPRDTMQVRSTRAAARHSPIYSMFHLPEIWNPALLLPHVGLSGRSMILRLLWHGKIFLVEVVRQCSQ